MRPVVSRIVGASFENAGAVLVLQSSDQENAGTRITDEYNPSSAQMFFAVTFSGAGDPMVRGALNYGKARR
jgi:hypothetical protein